MPKIITQIFLLNKSNEIFICKPSSQIFNNENICVEGKSIDEAILNIEDKWGILCDEGNLSELFWLEQLKDSEQIFVHGFILKTNFKKDEKDFLQARTTCQFVHYSKLIPHLEEFKIKANLRESLSTLIEKLEILSV